MISPISSGAAAYSQSVQPTKPQTTSASTSNAAQSSHTEDRVELSSQAKAALSGSSSSQGSQQSSSTYSRPVTLQAHSSKGAAATK